MKTALLLAALLAVVPAAAFAEQSCKAEMGARDAQIIVDRCLEVSPATHPPCNADNPCPLIVSEIKRGCEMLGDSDDTPDYCEMYTEGDAAGQ